MEYENQEFLDWREYFDIKIFQTRCWIHLIMVSLSMVCLFTILTTYIMLNGSSNIHPDDSFVTNSITAESRGDQNTVTF